VSTPIVSGKCAVQSNVIAFIRHLHDTRSQDLLATRRHWLVNAGLQKERRTEGLGGHLHLTEGGNEIEILTGAAGIMAGLFLFVSLRYFEWMRCKLSDRGETPSTQLSRLDHLKHP